MTKRRPSWSDRLRQAAALFCGLLLLNGSPAGAVASKKPSGKPVASKASKAPGKKSIRKTSRATAPAWTQPEIGAAEIIDTDTPGLQGSASFYGRGFQGRRTSTGEHFDVKQFTAASNHFPLGSRVAVRRLDNSRCAIVKVNDRMHARHRRRIIDVSRGTAEYLGMIRAGVVLVHVAPLKQNSAMQGADACRAAFDPEPECLSCEPLLRLPPFGEGGAN